jgi:hypothetical protein
MFVKPNMPAAEAVQNFRRRRFFHSHSASGGENGILDLLTEVDSRLYDNHGAIGGFEDFC